jgi:hypothetical protein
VILSVSLVFLLGVLVWFLVRFAALQGWHALLCVLFGFFLASTRSRPTSGMAATPSPGSSPESSSDQHTAERPHPRRKETPTHR